LSLNEALDLPGLPRDEGGPSFSEPWQAQAFALAVRLHAQGAFTWLEWAAALSHELARDPADDGSRYYHHWVRALETLIAERGLAAPSELATRKAAWADAYRRTPHGTPVELSLVAAETKT
jgi:nitrile hydratase accessory protein